MRDRDWPSPNWRRSATYNTKLCTIVLNFIIIKMHIRRKPADVHPDNYEIQKNGNVGTHLLPTRRVLSMGKII